MTSQLVQEDRIFNTRIYKGCSWDLAMQYQDDAGEGQDLSGYTVAMMVRKNVDSDILLSLTSSPAAGITLTAATGTIQIAITPTQSAAIQSNEVVYDVIIYNATTGHKEYLVGGTLEVIRTVTR